MWHGSNRINWMVRWRRLMDRPSKPTCRSTPSLNCKSSASRPAREVTINGIGRGVTPLTVRHLDAGEQRVRITLDGYDSVDRTIFLAEGLYARSLQIELRKASIGRAIAEGQ